MLDIDKDEAFDYSEGLSKLYSKNDYEIMIIEESEIVHSNREKYLAELGSD